VHGITSSSTDSAVYGEHLGSGIGVFGRGGQNVGEGVFGQSSSASSGVNGISSGGTGVFGRSDLAGSNDVDSGVRAAGIGVQGSNLLLLGTGVYGEGGDGGIGVKGICNNGTGVTGTSASGSGIEGYSGSPSAAGVRGVSTAGGNGVIAESSNVGVFAMNTGTNGARAWLASPGFAGDFHGNVNVIGSISKSGGGFAIDHLDPRHAATKYLRHSFVESPDMKNVYDGVATINDKGEAVVELPEYFSMLNSDFRYQLTPIGNPCPELHVAHEIRNNCFAIAGCRAGMRVSWQVTGIRQDPWAKANRIHAVEDKSPEEQGSYLHPELYGHSAEMGIHNSRYGLITAGVQEEIPSPSNLYREDRLPQTEGDVSRCVVPEPV
jgi:hypothetical protein